MTMFTKILLIVVFVAITAAVGVYCRKKATNVGDFVLGGRDVGPWLTAFAYGTSYFSSVVFVGYAGQFGWNFGVSAAWIGIGNAVIGSFMAWMILGRRTRIMTKHLEAATMPEFFAKRFDSQALKIIASVIIFVFLVPYSASVYKGLSGLFSIAFNIDFTWCIIGIAVLTGIYVITGGYTAAALNDFIQGIIMIGGIVCVIASVLAGKGGFTAALESLSHIPSEAAPNMNGAFTSFFGPQPLNLLSVVILTSLGSWGLPQMVHKFYTIKSEKSIKTGCVISTVFALIIAGGSYFMGAFGRLYYTADKIVFDDIVPTMLSSNLSDLLIGIVLILVLSASMSTLSSLVITSSSTFVLDFIKPLMRKNSSEESKSEVVMIKVLCAFFIVLSAVIALRPNSLITTLMSLSWGALAGAFLGPFMYGLYMKRATVASVWASFIFGIGISTVNLFTHTVPQTAAGAVSIVASIIIVPLVSLITKKPDDAIVQDAFACYEEKTLARQVKFLSETEEEVK